MSEIKIKENTVVSVHYRGTLTKNGEEFDNSGDREPLTFIVGFQQMIPGFEAALMGKIMGEKVEFDLTPDQAYGDHDPEMVKHVPIAQLPKGVKVGQQLALQGPGGQEIPLRITAVTDETATLDMNPKLAGEKLTFAVDIISVREATVEETTAGMTIDQIVATQSDCCKSGTCSI